MEAAMATPQATAIQPTRNGAPPSISEIELQLRANERRWEEIETDGVPESVWRPRCDECVDERDRLMAALEAAPITSTSDALAMMRAALFQLPPEVQERGEIFYFLPEEVAGRCLRQVLAWFEGTLAAPLAITEAMVADGMDAANKHRNADAEERVRAILAAALAAGQVEPRSTVIADLYRAAAAIQTRIDQAHAVEADGSPIVLELVACRDRILETAPSSAADVALQVRTLRVMLKEDRNRPERIEEALAQIADRLEALGAKARA
jgi:hypothetical protein